LLTEIMMIITDSDDLSAGLVAQGRAPVGHLKCGRVPTASESGSESAGDSESRVWQCQPGQSRCQ
jgi:hypothetical protein